VAKLNKVSLSLHVLIYGNFQCYHFVSCVVVQYIWIRRDTAFEIRASRGVAGDGNERHGGVRG